MAFPKAPKGQITAAMETIRLEEVGRYDAQWRPLCRLQTHL